MTSLQLFILIVYGLGCGFSQSLISVGASLLSVWAFGFVVLRWKSLKPLERVFCLLCLTWVIFSLLNLGLKPWSDRTSHGLRHLPYLLILALCLVKEFSAQRIFVLKASVLGLGVSLAMTLYQWFVLRHPGRGFFGNQIYLAYNAFFASLFYSEFLRKVPLKSPIPARWIQLGWVFSFLLVLLSESRFVWFLSFMYLTILGIPKAKKIFGMRKVLVFGFCALLFAVGMYAFEDRVQEKVHRTFWSEDASRTWRLKAWNYNWELFKAHPWIGVGHERNAIDSGVMPEFQGHWEPGRAIFAHSIYFQSLAESGLLGSLLLFGALGLLAFLVPALRVYLCFFAVAGMLENLFNNSKVIHSFYFYALMVSQFLKDARKNG